MQGRILPCPVCETPIDVNAAALLRGERSACPKCETAIAIEPGQGARDTIARFEQAKREIRQQRRA